MEEKERTRTEQRQREREWKKESEEVQYVHNRLGHIHSARKSSISEDMFLQMREHIEHAEKCVFVE